MKLIPSLRVSTIAIFVILAVVLAGGCAGQPAAPTPAPAPTAAPTLAAPTATVPPAAPTALPPTATAVPPTATSAPTAAAAPAEPTAEPTEVAEAPEPTAGETNEASQAAQPDVPAPPDAAGLAYDSSTHEFSYTSPSAISDLAKFYQQSLPAKGWQEDTSATVLADNLGSLEFARGDASLSITLMNPGGGADTSVSIDVSGLPEQAQGTAEVTPGAGTRAAGEALKAVDKDGLPVPEDYTNYEGESGLFRQSATVSSPSPLKTILALLRTELAARKWVEVPATVAATNDKASLQFTSQEEGKLDLKLVKNAAGGTDVVLTIRSEATAKAAGVLPPPGKARIYFGNVTDGPVVFTLDGKEFKAPVEAPGKTSMEGVPFIDVAPGSHDITLTLAGKAATSDKIEVGADEVWALVAGPGGALPLQMY